MKRKNLAFTVLELVVTLLIVGVLSTIAGVTYSKFTYKAMLAESYNGLDVMAKDQTTYYITHKSFLSTGPNPGFFQYSTGKMYGGATYNTSWNTVGYPFAVGTSVKFNYAVYAGRTDNGGTQIVTPIGSDGSGYWPTNVSLYSMRNIQPAGPGCTNYSINNYDHLDEFVTTTGKPQYNWAVLQASRDMNPGTDQCTYVIKVIDTNAKGIVQQGPVIVRDKGD